MDLGRDDDNENNGRNYKEDKFDNCEAGEFQGNDRTCGRVRLDYTVTVVLCQLLSLENSSFLSFGSVSRPTAQFTFRCSVCTLSQVRWLCFHLRYPSRYSRCVDVHSHPSRTQFLVFRLILTLLKTTYARLFVPL